MRVAGHEKRVGRTEMHPELWSVIMKGRCHLKELDADGGIKLKRNIKNKIRRRGLNSSASKQGQDPWSCEHGSESTGSIKCREFLKF